MKPIIIFDDHRHTEPSEVLLKGLPLLSKLGYKCYCAEHPETDSLDNAIQTYTNLLCESAILLDYEGIPRNDQIIAHFKKEEIEELYQSYISQYSNQRKLHMKETHEATAKHLQLLQRVQIDNIGFCGLEKYEQNDTFEKTCDSLNQQNWYEQRDAYMAKKFAEQCQRHNGGVFIILGLRHFKFHEFLLFELLSRNIQPICLTFRFIDTADVFHMNQSPQEDQYLLGINASFDKATMSLNDMQKNFTHILTKQYQNQENRTYAQVYTDVGKKLPLFSPHDKQFLSQEMQHRVHQAQNRR